MEKRDDLLPPDEVDQLFLKVLGPERMSRLVETVVVMDRWGNIVAHGPTVNALTKKPVAE